MLDDSVALPNSILIVKFVLLLLLVFYLPLTAFAENISSESVFQMRLVADEPSSDSKKMVVFSNSKDVAQTEMLLVQKSILIDQTDVASARVIKNEQFNFPQIEITFTESGSNRFAKVTRENIGKQLATIIAGRLYSAPRVMDEIPDGVIVISGSFNKQEAKELVDRIMGFAEKDDGDESLWESIRESVVTGFRRLRDSVDTDH